MSEFNPEQILQRLENSHNLIKYFPFVYIPESYIIELCDRCIELFLNEPSVLNLSAPINICGDTHGQFTDILRIFDVIGKPGEKQFLFLGDYIDRGAQSIENIVYLLTLKLLRPTSIYMLRGNHETEEVSTVYGLRDECTRRYSYNVFAKLIRVFDVLPFVAIVSDTIFCVHGGITHEPIEKLKEIKRPLEVNDSVPVVDLLWSDPGTGDGFVPSPRGISFIFGKEQAAQFMKDNNFSMIIRSHEFCQNGISFPFGKDGGLITVFSASNYCRTMNTGAIVSINEDLVLRFTMFTPEVDGYKVCLDSEEEEIVAKIHD
jgi:serine/threonine-protein phosphatase PP1 catalytic subunit